MLPANYRSASFEFLAGSVVQYHLEVHKVTFKLSYSEHFAMDFYLATPVRSPRASSEIKSGFAFRFPCFRFFSAKARLRRVIPEEPLAFGFINRGLEVAGRAGVPVQLPSGIFVHQNAQPIAERARRE